MQIEDMEAALEKIWDLHDKVSDAIHTLSRAHFLSTIKSAARASGKKQRVVVGPGFVEEGKCGGGFVFVKDLDDGEVEDMEGSSATIAEARSLHAIRAALENLEDQIEFFHTVQSQQQTERDAAIARLEQSRIILAFRLAEHHGRKYKVIDEAIEFIEKVNDTGRFIAPESLFKDRGHSDDGSGAQDDDCGNNLVQRLISGIAFAKKSLELKNISGLLGNAAIFAMSMLAMFQLHQVASKSCLGSEVHCVQAAILTNNVENRSIPDNGKRRFCNGPNQLDVLLGRG